MTQETKNTWYMNIAVSDKKIFDNFWEQGHRIWGYERGTAKMKVIPKTGDRVIVLSRKHIIYTGTVVTDLDTTKATPRGGIFFFCFEKQEPSIFINKCFRRNYTLCQDDTMRL